MAVKDFFDNLKGGARWDVGVSINRSNSLPLDANSVFDSLEAAQNYAAGNPAEGTLANAYPGQVLAVVTDAETIIYYIDANMALQPVGNTKDVMAYIGDIPETSDAKTIVEYINSKTEGIATTDSLAQLQKDVQALADTVNGKEASGEDEAVVGLVTEVANIKEAIGVEASEGVEATGLEKKIADEIVSREAGDKANADDIAAIELAINGREASDGVEAVTGLTTRIANNEQGISDINDKIGTVAEGKTVADMISDVEGKIPTNVSAFTNDAKYQTDIEVLATVEAKIAEINHAVFQKVDAIPAAADAETNVLYLVPNGDKMDIYAKVGEEMVLIDDTDADLTGYALKADLHEHTNKDELDKIVDGDVEKWNKIPEDIIGGEGDTKDSDTITGAKKYALDEATKAKQEVIGEQGDGKDIDSIFGVRAYVDDALANIDISDIAVSSNQYPVEGTGDLGNVLADISERLIGLEDIGAEKNVIASVDETQFNIDSDRKLTLLDIAQSKITGLTDAKGSEITLADALVSKVDKKYSEVTVKDDEGNETTKTVEWTLLSPENQAKLEGLVVDPETGETSLPISGQISMSQVDGLDEALNGTNGKVDKVDGMGLSANNFTDTLLEKLNGIAAGAQVNVIEGIKFNGATVTVGEDKIADITYALPIADDDTLGGVKSVKEILDGDGKITNAKAIENKITVANDGTMEVYSLNVNKLTQTDDEYLIMNGGSASI
jgi:hypothetical protein